MKTTPVQFAISAFGGVRALAEYLGITTQSVYQQRDVDAPVPREWMRPLLGAVKDREVALTPEDLIFSK